MKGIFITIEGGDGAGKTTQIKNITDYFESRGIEVIKTREPGGTEIGEKIRNILLDKDNIEMTSVAEMFLYASARAQLVREVVIHALAEKKVVICDRFVDSSIAYQGYARNLGSIVEEVNKYATRELEPDITFWLDIDPDKGKLRAGNIGEHDRIESETSSFHADVRRGYREIQKKYPERVKRIDAEKSIGEMSREIKDYLDELCKKREI